MNGTGQNGRRALAATRVVLGRRWVRRTLVVVGGAVALVLLARPAAIGGDLLSNVGPASQLQDGALMDAHPLGHYTLDHHFSAVKAGVLSGVDVSGIPPTIAWFLAQTLWQLTAFIAHALITLFTFAFSLDLVGGSGATGGASALEPVSKAVRSIYQRTFGEPWLIVAVLVSGLWAIYNALVRRRYVETAGSLAVSVVFVVIALAFVTQPERTIGTASQWSNAMSGAFLSLTANGSVGDQARAKQSAADQLFTLLVYEPWAVLQFGGREHCVRYAGGDKPQSVAVRPLSTDATRDGTLSRRLQRADGVQADGKVCISNRNKHAPKFLRFPAGSDERDKLYEAVKDGDKGKLDDDDPAKRDTAYRLGPEDKPAAASMGKGGQYERLLMAIVIFAGELGIFLLLGALSVSVILAQVLVLLLLAFAPVSLVVGVFPGRGHAFFVAWLSRLAGFLLRKAIYSLLLAVLLAVGAAISEATSSLGWLMAFGLQAAFYWSVFLFRHQLTSQLSLATTGEKSGTNNQAVRLASLYAVAQMARRALPGTGGPTSRRAAPPAPTAATSPPADEPPPPEPDQQGAQSSSARPDEHTTSLAARGAAEPADAPPVAQTPHPRPTASVEALPPATAARATTDSGTGSPSSASTSDRRAGDGPARSTPSASQAERSAQQSEAPERPQVPPRREAPTRPDGAIHTPPNPSIPSGAAETGQSTPDKPGRHDAAAGPYPERAPSETRGPLERDLQGDADRMREGVRDAAAVERPANGEPER